MSFRISLGLNSSFSLRCKFKKFKCTPKFAVFNEDKIYTNLLSYTLITYYSTVSRIKDKECTYSYLSRLVISLSKFK